jgi:serine/threonine protein phosphatase PrpC
MPTITTATLSRSGARERNEDAVRSVRHGDLGCWVVADGLGGHGAGDMAAQTAAQAVVDDVTRYAEEDGRADASLASILHAAVDAAQAALAERQDDVGVSGMRTTIVVLVMDGDDALWGHVGDSRLYHFRDDTLRARTQDHSVVQVLVDAGEISPDEARDHDDQNRLLRALGSSTPHPPDVPEEPSRVQSGDAFLLCTDGFWGAVPPDAMETRLAAADDPESWLASMARSIDDRRGDQDNYTAVGLFVE